MGFTKASRCGYREDGIFCFAIPYSGAEVTDALISSQKGMIKIGDVDRFHSTPETQELFKSIYSCTKLLTLLYTNESL